MMSSSDDTHELKPPPRTNFLYAGSRAEPAKPCSSINWSGITFYNSLSETFTSEQSISQKSEKFSCPNWVGTFFSFDSFLICILFVEAIMTSEWRNLQPLSDLKADWRWHKLPATTCALPNMDVQFEYNWFSSVPLVSFITVLKILFG